MGLEGDMRDVRREVHCLSHLRRDNLEEILDPPTTLKGVMGSESVAW